MATDHSIARQSIVLTSPNSRVAPLLQPKLSDINRTQLLPAIETVFDEFDRPGGDIVIDRLNLDLGTVSFDELDSALVARLIERLRAELSKLIDRDADAATDVVRLSPEDADLAILERYLTSGRLPAWAPLGPGFDPNALIRKTAAADAGRLVTLLRRISDDTVLGRLVAQLDETALERLVDVLAPGHAAQIIAAVAAVADIRAARRAEPAPVMSEAAFTDHVWRSALAYLVASPGKPFKRRAFVAALRRGAADERDALPRGRTDADLATLEHYLLTGRLPAQTPLGSGIDLNALILKTAAAGPNRLSALLRRIGDDAVLGRLAARLDEAVFERLVHVLAPGNAALIIATVADVGAAHRVESVPAMSEAAFTGQIRLSTLAYLVTLRGRPFDRRTFVASLLRRLAADSGTDQPDVLAAFQRAVQALEKTRPVRSSLPDTLLAVAKPDVGAGGDDATSVGEAGGAAAGGEQDPTSDSDAGLEPSSEPHSDPLGKSETDLLVSYLRSGRFDARPSDTQSDALTAGEVVAGLLELPGARLRHIMIEAVKAGGTIHLASLLALLPQDVFSALVGALMRTELKPEAPFQQALDSYAKKAEDRHSFHARLLLQVLNEEPIDFDELVQGPTAGTGVGDGDASIDDDLARAAEAPQEEAGPQEKAEPQEGAEEIAGVLHRLLADLPAAFRPPPSDLKAILRSAPAAVDHRFRTAQGLADWLARNLDDAISQPFLTALRQTVGRQSERENWGSARRALFLSARELLEQRVRRPRPDQGDTKPRQPAPAPDRREQTLAFLRSGRVRRKGLPPVSDRDLDTAIEQLASQAPGETLAAIRAGLASERTRAALARRLSVTTLRGLTALLAPQHHRLLLDTVGDLADALRAQLVAEGGRPFAKPDLWAFILRFLTTTADTSWTAEDVRSAFLLSEVKERLREPDVFASSIDGATRFQDGPAGIVATRDAPAELPAELPALLRSRDAGKRRRAAAILERYLPGDDQRGMLVARLSDDQLAASLRLLEPRRHKLMRDTATLMFEALGPAHPAVADDRQPNLFMLSFLARHRGRSWSVESIVRTFLEDFAMPRAAQLPTVSAQETFLASVLASATSQAEARGPAAVKQAIRKLAPLVLPEGRSDRRPAGRPHPDEAPFPSWPEPAGLAPPSGAGQERETRDPIYIGNAGIVLAAPFLPPLFRDLDFLSRTDDGTTVLKDRDTASRAVHLLQYLADNSTATPEPLLVLNKLLCGLPTASVISPGIEPRPSELEACAKLHASVLANWPALSTGTSVAGLQESFFQREGRLTFDGDKWTLKVERKTLDILLDQVPWGFRTIFHAWMPHVLQVDW